MVIYHRVIYHKYEFRDLRSVLKRNLLHGRDRKLHVCSNFRCTQITKSAGANYDLGSNSKGYESKVSPLKGYRPLEEFWPLKGYRGHLRDIGHLRPGISSAFFTGSVLVGVVRGGFSLLYGDLRAT